MASALEQTRQKVEERLKYIVHRYDKELWANVKRQEYMQKIEGHFKLVASDPEKLEKLSIRISEFIDKLK
jgi:hypothetical protein